MCTYVELLKSACRVDCFQLAEQRFQMLLHSKNRFERLEVSDDNVN